MEQMTRDNYERLLNAAKRYMRRCNRDIVDGKDAHDYAMETLMETSSVVAVYRNIIDGIRRECGRSGKRKSSVNIDFCNIGTMDDSIKELDEIINCLPDKNDYRFIAKSLSCGIPQKDIADMLGKTPSYVSWRLKQMRTILREKGIG